MAVGPNDYYGDLIPDPEEDWPEELPEMDEQWLADWRSITLPDRPVVTQSKPKKAA
jgi:hypothetical protein